MTSNVVSLLDEAISYRRQVAIERRKLEWKAQEAIRLRPLRSWAAKVPIQTPGRLRETLKALVALCGYDKANGMGRWRCEPRCASLAKRLGITERAVQKHTAALEREGILIRLLIPGRKRTRGRSCYAYYLAIHGHEAALKWAEKDGLTPPPDDEPEGEPDDELSSCVLGKGLRPLTDSSCVSAPERFRPVKEKHPPRPEPLARPVQPHWLESFIADPSSCPTVDLGSTSRCTNFPNAGRCAAASLVKPRSP